MPRCHQCKLCHKLTSGICHINARPIAIVAKVTCSNHFAGRLPAGITAPRLSPRYNNPAFNQADTLVADGPLHGAVRLPVAVRFGTARLIDNDGGMVPGTPA